MELEILFKDKGKKTMIANGDIVIGENHALNQCSLVQGQGASPSIPTISGQLELGP